MNDIAASRDTPQAGEPLEPTPEDVKLAGEIVAAIDAEFDGAPPEGIDVAVMDKRASIAGCVEDASTAERIEKAASRPAGLLGVHNTLQWRTPEPEPVDTPVSQGLLDQGEPLDAPSGQINHKV